MTGSFRQRLYEMAAVCSIISAVATGLAYWLESIPALTFGVSLILFLVALVIFLVLATARWAMRKVRALEQLPGPRWLAPFLTGRLPPEVGTKLDLEDGVRILVVADTDYRSDSERIKEKYQGDHVEIDVLEVDGSDLATLSASLREAEAVYLFWSTATSQRQWVIDAVNRWAHENSEKPIIAVNYIPESPYRLTFNTLPEKKSISGLWRLLARSGERGLLWRRHARVCQKLVYAIGFLLFIFLGVHLVAYLTVRKIERNQDDSNKAVWYSRHEIDRPFIVERLINTSDNRRRITELSVGEGTSQSSQVSNEILNSFAEYMAENLGRTMAPEGIGIASVTFWASVWISDQDSGRCLCEVGWSDRTGITCFVPGSNSVVGCAIERGRVVYWGRSINAGFPVIVGDEDSGGCAWDPKDDLPYTEALVCVSRPVPHEGAMRSAICLQLMRENESVQIAPRILAQIGKHPDLDPALVLLYSLPHALYRSEKVNNTCKQTLRSIIEGQLEGKPESADAWAP
jgi:hypothetical protein